VSYIGADLTHHRQLRNVLFASRSPPIDTVVHLPSDPGSDLHEGHALSGHAELTRQLLLLCEEHPSIERFVLRSFADVYLVSGDVPILIDEDHPLAMSKESPQSIRAHVEADVTASARIGTSRLRIAVLRCAEILAKDTGSLLYDYLSSRVCLRPLGYDPMVNVLSLGDAAHAICLAALGKAQGIFNIPGADSLPLSELVYRTGRLGVPLPGGALGPLYRLRALTTKRHYRYESRRAYMHYAGILDGRRARTGLGYVAQQPLSLGALF
jgi:UDP-glucose 4-epimerase